MRAYLHLFSLSPNKESIDHVSVSAIKLPKHYLIPRKPFVVYQEQLGTYLSEEEMLILSFYDERIDGMISGMFANQLLNHAEALNLTATILKEKARKLIND